MEETSPTHFGRKLCIIRLGTSVFLQGKEYERRAQKLKEDVKGIFAEAIDLVAKLELIHSVTKLGLASHFDVEIKEALDTIALFTKKKNNPTPEDLYTTALCFRLLREHGYEVSQGQKSKSSMLSNSNYAYIAFNS